ADFQHLDFADVIESVGRSVLGLSIGCARCHDHKYDPVNMDDYYALYGILQSTRWPFPGGEEHKRPAHFAPLILADEAARQDKLRAERLSRLDTDIRQLKAQAVSAVVATIATGLANIVVPPPDLMQPIAKSGAGLTAATRQRAAVDEKELYPVAYGVTEGSV